VKRPGALLLASLSLTVACSNTPAPAAPSLENVLVITIDTLRADRLGAYGATNVATPNLDRLARDGAWFPQADAPSPLTRPSHISLFTGLLPAEHGIRDNVAPSLRPDLPVLAEAFKRAGFSTAAFVASPVLERQSGLARGFDHYSDRFDRDVDEKRGDVVADEAITWLSGKTRFFAWVHLYDPHAPYQPPDRYAADYAGRPYDGEVAWSDEIVGRIVTALSGAGTLERTLVVVTSDHGESLGEHGEDTHGYFVYQSTLRVPLIVAGPGVKPGTRVETVARTIDLYPTILELVRLRPEDSKAGVTGRSLVPAFAGGRIADESSISESLVPLLQFGWSDLRSIRDGRWKYILAPRPELYDLDRDPGEQRDLAAAEPSRAQALRAALEDHLRREQKAVQGDAAAAVPPELRERLGAVGYFGQTRQTRISRIDTDPKDKIDEYKTLTGLMQQGLVALRAGRPAETVARFDEAAKLGVDGYELHYYRGRALAALKRWKPAAADFEKAIEKLPKDAAALRALGESRVALEDWPRAARAYEQLVAIAPADAVARAQLGEVYRDLHRWNDAIKLLREAIAIDSGPAAYWNSLGTVLGASDRIADAERAFAEAAIRDPRNPLYFFNRGIALERLGRRDDAIGQYRRASELGSAPASTRLAQLAAISRRP
jgi:arylsulfatase A-like enzyme/Flp pilus assembly protein TadD